MNIKTNLSQTYSSQDERCEEPVHLRVAGEKLRAARIF